MRSNTPGFGLVPMYPLLQCAPVSSCRYLFPDVASKDLYPLLLDTLLKEIKRLRCFLGIFCGRWSYADDVRLFIKCYDFTSSSSTLPKLRFCTDWTWPLQLHCHHCSSWSQARWLHFLSAFKLVNDKARKPFYGFGKINDFLPSACLLSILLFGIQAWLLDKTQQFNYWSISNLKLWVLKLPKWFSETSVKYV